MTKEKDTEQQDLVTRAFSVREKESGKDIILRPNSNRTVQSIALMRLGLFVPSPKSVGRQNREYKTVGFDATKELQTLSLMESEGFTNISIVGERLDMSVDFKTWMGIIRTYANHPINNDTISLKFTEFLKLCTPENYRSSTASRKRIDASLRRLASVTLSFTSNNSSKVYTTHLVQSALLDPESDHLVSDLLGFYQAVDYADYTPFLHICSKEKAYRIWDYYGPVGQFKNKNIRPLLFPDPLDKSIKHQPYFGHLPAFMCTVSPVADPNIVREIFI